MARMSALARIIVIILLAAGLFWFHTSRQNRPTRVELATKNKTLILGNGGEPETMDLQLATGQPEHHIYSSLYEGLVAPLPDNPDGNGPGAAASWEHSPDFITWTFHLQPNGRWSDGRPVTAHDFVYSYQRELSPALGGQYAAFALTPLTP